MNSWPVIRLLIKWLL